MLSGGSFEATGRFCSFRPKPPRFVLICSALLCSTPLFSSFSQSSDVIWSLLNNYHHLRCKHAHSFLICLLDRPRSIPFTPCKSLHHWLRVTRHLLQTSRFQRGYQVEDPVVLLLATGITLLHGLLPLYTTPSGSVGTFRMLCAATFHLHI